MRKKIVEEIRAKSRADLVKEAQTLIKEIALLRLAVKVNPVKDTNTILKKRKRLAIVLTIRAEKQMTERKE